MRPRVFIGSSTAGLPVADAIQAHLATECEAEVWNQGLFGPGDIILDKLIELTNRFDAAVMAFTPDDEAIIHGRGLFVPRDNVIFELGMFTGKRGKGRAFVIAPSATENLRILSDLGGVVRGEYDPKAQNLRAALGPACRLVLEKLRDVAPRPGLYTGNTWNALAKNWRSYGEERGYIDVYGEDIVFGPGRYRYPGHADHLIAPWRTIGLQIRRDRAEDPLRMYLVTEQLDGTSRKIYFGTHHTSLHVKQETPDELRVPIRYYGVGEWNCLQIRTDTINHGFIKDAQTAVGLRFVGPIWVRHVFLCDAAAELPEGFRKRAIDVL
jgi:hypothetical protein